MISTSNFEAKRLRVFAVGVALGLLSFISIVSSLIQYPDSSSTRVFLTFLLAGISAASLSFLFLRWSKIPKVTKASEIFSISVISIIFFIVSSAIVYLVAGIVSTLDAAIWEASAGITTTAVSGLEPNSLASSVHIFRSLTQWVGGLCTLCLVFVATPISSRDDTASSGYAEKIFSRSIKQRLNELTILYLSITIVIFLGYFLAGMGVFDAICHSFTTSSTGGLSTRALSIGSFDSPAIEWVATIGMLVGGLNLGILWLVWKRKFTDIRKNSELRLYLLILVLSTCIFWWKLDTGFAVFTELRNAFFVASSLLSTTGYVNMGWEFTSGVSAVALLILAIGGMAGSTGGGFGVHRLLEIIKYLRRELTLSYRPSAVRAIKVSGEEIEQRELDKLHGYTATFIFIVAGGAFLLSLASQHLNLADSIGLALSSFVTSGPGLTTATSVGFEHNAVSNIVLSSLMVVGRLSIFPIAYVVLFSTRNLRLGLVGFRRKTVSD